MLPDSSYPNHIFAIFGYGCHLNNELSMYLDNNVAFANREKPDCLVFCGGFTQRKSAPGVSEAKLMFDYVVPRLSYVPHDTLIEQDSYTTQDNAEKLVSKLGLLLCSARTKLTVACEATRTLKVDLAVRSFLRRRPYLLTTSWELMSPQKQIISTLYDWVAIKFPPLALYFRNKRIRRAEQI